MKKLILLVALSLVFLSGYSQENGLVFSKDITELTIAPISLDSLFKDDNIYSLNYNGITIPKYPSPDEMFIVKFLMYYDEYEQICFNDSTEIIGLVPTSDTIYIGPSSSVSQKYYEYKKLYNHKQPTFEGFMEYLKNKFYF